MRCKCCDSSRGKWWEDDYYCTTCRSEIQTYIKRDEDKHRLEESDDIPLLDSRFDEED